MSTLVISLNSDDTTESVGWLVEEDSQRLANGCCLLAEIHSEVRQWLDTSQQSYQTVVLIPDSSVLFTKVEVPGRSQARMRQAARYVLEPLIADDIEDMHVAIGQVSISKPVSCAAVLADRFQSHLDLLDAHGLTPQIVSTLGIVAATDRSIAVISAAEHPVLTTVDSAVTGPNTLISDLCRRTLSNSDETQEISFYGFEHQQDLVDEITHTFDTQLALKNKPIYELLLAAATDAGYLNLRQGVFEFQDESPKVLNQVKRVLATAACTLLVVSLVFAIEGAWARHKTAQLTDESVLIYQEVYGTDQVVGNPIFRMQEQLATRQNESGWLKFLDSLRQAQSGTSIEVSNIDYQGLSNTMSVICIANSFGSFEQFEQSLIETGVGVEVSSAEQQDSKVWARLTLTL